MRIHFTHISRYRYSKPVMLLPHILRLRPREDGFQRLLSFRCSILPGVHHDAPMMDAEGNVVFRAWFDLPVNRLDVRTEGLVETLRTNPFDFILESEALRLPLKNLELRYPALQANLVLSLPKTREKKVRELSEELLLSSKAETMAYIAALQLHLSTKFKRLNRPEGEAWSAEETLKKGQGSCRDLAVLFMELCRMQGLPARFVSGYFLENPSRRSHDLHAWAEVYLPGAGWRGFDPSCGLACGSAHVPLCAAARPADCSPLEGLFSGNARSDFESSVELKGSTEA
jgi:transglutaminase-like putative cysteine protease